MSTYVDSSVLLRVLFGQPDQLAEWTKLDERFASELLRVETLRTVDRAAVISGAEAASAARLRAAALELVSTIRLVQVSTSVLDRAGDSFPTPLGTLDAIHLATALHLAGDFPGLSFATHDTELGLAAKAVGFEVVGI